MRKAQLPFSFKLLLVVAFAFLLVAVLGHVGGMRAPRSAPLVPNFDSQGHRGARGLEPENTIPAFERALAIGVMTLEMDIGMTADGRLVVHHDRRLNPERTRRPDGTWISADPPPALRHLDLAALQSYDVGGLKPGSKSAKRFPGQRRHEGLSVPTLEAVLRRAEALSGGTMRYNIETKISPLAPEESPEPEVMVERLVQLLRALAVTERSLVQSFDWRTLQRVQAIAPEIATAYLTAERPWLDNLERGQPGVSPWTAGIDLDGAPSAVPEAIAQAGGAVWSPYHRDLEDAALAEAKRLGLEVVVWTVNDPDEMAALIGRGVDGIITDYPDRLRAVMSRKGLPLPPTHESAN